MSKKAKILDLYSQIIDDQDLLITKYSVYKYRDEPITHLSVKCPSRINSSLKTRSLNPKEIKLSFVQLISNAQNYNNKYNICDLCYWTWYDSVLTPIEARALSLLLSCKEVDSKYRVQFNDLLLIGKNSNNPTIFNEVIELLFNLKNFHSYFKSNSKEEHRLSKAVKKEFQIIATLKSEVDSYLKRYQSEFENYEIKDTLKFSYFKDKNFGFTPKEITELFTPTQQYSNEVFQELLNIWFNSLESNPEDRYQKLKFSLEKYNPYMENYDSVNSQNWESFANKTLKKYFTSWEKEYQKRSSAKGFIYLVNNSLYETIPKITPLFEIFYPYVEIRDKAAYWIPSYWKDWVSSSDFNTSHLAGSSYLGSYEKSVDLLPQDFTQEEISTLLELWEPNSDNLYKSAREISKVIKKL